MVEPDDKITYAEAEEITGYSHVHLWRLVRAGELTREGGGQPGGRTAWLSRAEVEALALREYHPGRMSAYWMTTSEAAEVLGVTSETVRQRLPTHRAGKRTLIVRRDDVLRAAMKRAVDGDQSWAR